MRRLFGDAFTLDCDVANLERTEDSARKYKITEIPDEDIEPKSPRLFEGNKQLH